VAPPLAADRGSAAGGAAAEVPEEKVCVVSGTARAVIQATPTAEARRARIGKTVA
jgi:hypothetical protein